MRLGLVSSNNLLAKKIHKKLISHLPFVEIAEADIIVALGGDGFMLHTLHKYKGLHKPVFGINCGTIGFLMNRWQEHATNNLPLRIQQAVLTPLYPLLMQARTTQGKQLSALAINEVSLLRQIQQTAHLRLEIDGKVRLPELICDGVLVATAAGSTAYNLSAHGPIIPIGNRLLALTPISPFRPRRWRGALLPDTATVKVSVLEPKLRPVSAAADNQAIRHLESVIIRQDPTQPFYLLFDPEHNLEERIISEQFGL